jgi:cytochrome c553
MPDARLGAPIGRGAAVPTVKRWLVPALAAVVVGSMGCASRSGPEVAPRMRGHFARAGDLYTAVATGDLAAARVQAEAIRQEETGAGMASRAKAYIEQLNAFADLAARAPDVTTAASAAANVGATCGACHRAMKQGPRYQAIAEPPTATAPVSARMIRHRWAADRLWEGLIGPSDTAWAAGAGALIDAPLYTDALTREVAQYEPVTALAWTVHDIGARARMETDAAARAQLFGQLLGTCARCHELLKSGP